MKKPYTKPMLYAESFILVEHISTGCRPGLTGNQGSEISCNLDMGDGMKLFLISTDPGPCAFTLEDFEELEFYQGSLPSGEVGDKFFTS